MPNHLEDNRSSDRRARIEGALAQYPHVDAQTLAELIHWFRKKATPLDAESIAIDPKLREPYRLLKARHLDRVRGADLYWIAALLMVTGISLAVTVWAIV